jgi:hypothetical protein
MSFPLTAVSGYWPVKNKHDTKYLNWFQNTLKINCPYVFFGTTESIDLVKQYRGSLPTYYIECKIEEFYTYKYKDRILTNNGDCPSVELNMIWNEKIFFIEKAARLNPFNSEFFAWFDAGICSYREKSPPLVPFPDTAKLEMLPKDKFIFTSSDRPHFEPHRLSGYYHYISGTYILHKDIIQHVVELYIEYMDKLINLNNIYTDQVILTYIYKDNMRLFYKIGHGYGEIIPLLY